MKRSTSILIGVIMIIIIVLILWLRGTGNNTSNTAREVENNATAIQIAEFIMIEP